MKNHNLLLTFKSGKKELICHVDTIWFDKKYAKDMCIRSYGLVTYINSSMIESIETTTKRKL